MRARRIFKAAKTNNTNAVHRNKEGEAIPIPIATPRSQSEPSIVAGSSEPYATRIRKKDG